VGLTTYFYFSWAGGQVIIGEVANVNQPDRKFMQPVYKTVGVEDIAVLHGKKFKIDGRWATLETSINAFNRDGEHSVELVFRMLTQPEVEAVWSGPTPAQETVVHQPPAKIMGVIKVGDQLIKGELLSVAGAILFQPSMPV
jgi:hypothetical protein